MHNNVVVALCAALAEEGFEALRFNFRGVGRSGGAHGGGVDEREDARAALDFLASRPGVDASRLCLAGYSFGAIVALSLGDERLTASAAVSAPLGRETPLNLTCPTLFVFGERDNIAPPRDLERIGGDLPAGSRVAVVPGADHFWLGFEDRLAGEVGYFFLERISAS
jgi:alpha/beta superfamily hydrolase